jgi:serine/threonine protein kinase
MTNLAKMSSDRSRTPILSEDEILSIPDYYSVIEGDQSNYEYIVVHRLGSGDFGYVFKVRKYEDETLFALKLIYGCIQHRDIQREIKILSNISHPNIVKYINSTSINPKSLLVNLETTSLSLAIIMELCDDNLLEKFNQRQNIDNNWNKESFCQILDGLGYLHSKKIIHRDLKPENILLKYENGRDVIKIGDFGLSKIGTLQPTIPSRCLGTLKYMSPELQFGYLCNYKSDIFSLGIILMEFYTLENTDNWIVSFRRRDIFKILNINANRDIIRLALAMTKEYPDDRPNSCENIKEHFLLIT